MDTGTLVGVIIFYAIAILLAIAAIIRTMEK